MATRVVREVRKRGVMGWIFLILFYGVNIYFAYALFKGLQAAAPSMNDSRAAQAGTAIGVSFVLAIWAFATVITGLLAMLTRGRRVLVEDGISAAGRGAQKLAVER